MFLSLLSRRRRGDTQRVSDHRSLARLFLIVFRILLKSHGPLDFLRESVCSLKHLQSRFGIIEWLDIPEERTFHRGKLKC